MDAETTLLFVVVVGARFLVPLLIPRYPLPAILAALVLDAADQTIFQLFGVDPPGYQGYDKAMDVYYLAIAYLATLRNWTSEPALRVARFLYFYRLIGVVAFELTQVRALLLIFPNTFEYFFIAYEIIRLRRNPARYNMRFWVLTAAAIWIFIKLPQEYWIHVAQLDVTDTMREFPWLSLVVILLAAGLAVVAWLVIPPRLPGPDWSWRVPADPLPEEIDTAAERDRWVAAHRRLLSAVTFEKVMLVGLITVIFGQVLPGRQSSDLELFLGVAVFVVVNAAISLWAARRSRSVESVLLAFGSRVLVNVGLVILADWLLRREEGELNEANALFFVLLLSLLTLLDDRYRPVYEARFAAAAATPGPPPPTAASGGERQPPDPATTTAG
ncbi:MAG TPA: hypothetical protein VFR67_02795 [Pilimelia sp.]|nr:hypothetical protein [Pilimelia sp.]